MGERAWNSTLPRRKTALKAKSPWRRKAIPVEKTRNKPLPKGQLKKVSKSRRKAKREYFGKHPEFLERFPWCAICLARGIHPPNPSTEIHHARGRIGRLLNDERFFIASCRPCRLWPHENTAEARALGVLAEPQDWNVYPEK